MTLRCRVVVVEGPSTCGRQATEVATVTAAAVTAIQTASTRCQSAVHQSTVLCRGTPNPAPRHWPLPTAVEARQNDR